MLSAKKVDFKTIALMVVSVLLVMSFSVLGTMAWFADNDNASGTISMGRSIDIEIKKDDPDTGKFEIIVSGSELIPGMQFAPNLQINVKKPETGKTTAALLRAKFSVEVAGNNNASTQLTNELKEFAEDNGWVEHGGYFYYIGTAEVDGVYVMTTTADGQPAYSGSGTGGTLDFAATDAKYISATNRGPESNVTKTILASVIPNNTNVTINFIDAINQSIRIPTGWTQEQFAGKTVTITFEVQAVQDLIFDRNIDADYDLPPTIENALIAFSGAFPQG